jgi:IS605 OrfB family transposase
MKITRSTKCTLKYATDKKKEQLNSVLIEYGKVTNVFIDYFWKNGVVKKTELLKPVVDIPINDTWLSARLRKVSAREALDMVNSVKEVFEFNKEQLETSISSIESKLKTTIPNTKKNRRRINNLHCILKKKKMKLDMITPHKPVHKGKRMSVSSTTAELQNIKKSSKVLFDAWLHIASVGNKITMNLPIKYHKHFNELNTKSHRLNAYIITNDYVQFCFERETGEKKEVKTLVGVDTGINALASTSNREQLGLDIKECVNRKKRCEYGSKGYKRATNALKQRINEVAKVLVKNTDLVVVEKLKNLNNNSKLKGRLSRNIRSSIGKWNYSYWLKRLEMVCEENRVSFRAVSPYYTSQKCSVCGYTNRTNREGEKFLCQKCNHSDNADINAAFNILSRFVTGKYGSCYKHLVL